MLIVYVALIFFDPELIGHICRRGAMMLYMYRDLLPHVSDEFEIGVVQRIEDDSFIIKWQVISSTSGCYGLEYEDRHVHGPIYEPRWQSLYNCNNIFDKGDENSLLCWSSMPIIRRR